MEIFNHRALRLSPIALTSLIFVACGRAQPLSPTGTPVVKTAPVPTVAAGSRWELVWQDNFEGPALNPQNWSAESGAGGWGNNEWQFYTDRPENLRLEEGLLIIEARQETYLGSDFTSARIKTQSHHSWAYGRFEARMKIPSDQGIWPAFWMLGSDFPTVGWPASGEIDIMEHIGQPQTIYGTVHGPGYSGGDGVGDSHIISGEPLSETFRTYAIEWKPEEVRWYVDETLFNAITPADVPGEWVYDHPFFIILNLAVGGEWPGYPDPSTEFPQHLIVDYVRVFQDSTLSPESLEPDTAHVAALTLELEEATDNWQAKATVRVVDSAGDPVQGMEVSGGWLGVVTGATSAATTDEAGIAGPFTGQITSFAEEVSFCVTNLTKPLYTYEKNQNAITCTSKAAAPQE